MLRRVGSNAKDKKGKLGQRSSDGLVWTVLPVVIGVIGTLAVYFLIPTISIMVLPSESRRALVSVGNSGIVPISDIHVECRGNKAVFAHAATLALNGYSPISEFSAPRVAGGEGFTAECPQPW